MQIDAKLKHYKVFYQLFFYKLKTIKTHLSWEKCPPHSFILKKDSIVIMLTPREPKTPFLTS